MRCAINCKQKNCFWDSTSVIHTSEFVFTSFLVVYYFATRVQLNIPLFFSVHFILFLCPYLENPST